MKQIISMFLLASLGSLGCASRDQGALLPRDVAGLYEDTWQSSDRERSFSFEERAILSPSGSISYRFILRGKGIKYEANKAGTFRLDGDQVVTTVTFDWRDGVRFWNRPTPDYHQVSGDLGRAFTTGENLVFQRAEGGKALALKGRKLLLQSQGTLASR